MVIVKYMVNCPLCNKKHDGEIAMFYRKDNKFNVRMNNKNTHTCGNCSKEFIVEIDSYGNVTATPKNIENGIYPWEKISEGKIVEIIEHSNN
ncbi:MAG: hypothetical protein B6U88_01280 [Candidatus Aenigmarchaeota archaeon ex4484_56]|nr:MAG: hypothetical protein B6U88_01280 [Candidatus Aenigmarchaeota archaeon ex4484_56]